MSLYPYICKYFKFPISHPRIHVGDACKDVETFLRMEGVIKCTIVQPQKLYHLLHPYRCSKKRLFSLCRTCVDTCSTGECTRTEDAERALTGTWVMDEVRLALEKGYRILEIDEVYEYQVTQYDLETGAVDLFVDYINTFLKLKAEARGYPGWLGNPEEEEQCIESFWKKAKDWIGRASGLTLLKVVWPNTV